MNAWQKILSASLAGLVWCLAIVAKHFWPDIDISGISAACSGTLSGLGVYHTMQSKNEAEIPQIPANSQAILQSEPKMQTLSPPTNPNQVVYTTTTNFTQPNQENPT